MPPITVSTTIPPQTYEGMNFNHSYMANQN